MWLLDINCKALKNCILSFSCHIVNNVQKSNSHNAQFEFTLCEKFSHGMFLFSIENSVFLSSWHSNRIHSLWKISHRINCIFFSCNQCLNFVKKFTVNVSIPQCKWCIEILFFHFSIWIHTLWKFFTLNISALCFQWGVFPFWCLAIRVHTLSTFN